MTGPLSGLRVVELAGLGPGPHAAMQLADLGADVVRVDRPVRSSGADLAGDRDDILRSRRSVVIDLKSDDGPEAVLSLASHADVLIEGFRPGVAERLGVGPEDCQARNRRLIYARITGWGQDGPKSSTAGHDLTYVATSGVLHAIGRADESPPPPLNVVGDYGGGSMFVVVGVLAALFERSSSGRGQIIDAAMVEGAALLGQQLWAMIGAGTWTEARSSNLLDGAAPFYDTYRCADDRFLAVAAIEPEFYRQLLEGLGLENVTLPDQYDSAAWPVVKQRFSEIISTRTRDEWAGIFDGTDACVAPVLSPLEAPYAAHARQRKSFVELDGIVQPAPAPRFSRTVNGVPSPPPATGEHQVEEILREWSQF